MTHIRNATVRLTAAHPVEIEPGLFLPAGSYAAESREIGVPARDGLTNWSKADYLLEFTGEQLAAMGVKNPDNLASAEYDLTAFVTSGEIVVS